MYERDRFDLRCSVVMVQGSNMHAARSSQELADKQEETGGGQLVEALQLLRTVEDDSSSRGAECSGTSLQSRGSGANSGTLSGGLGGSLGGKRGAGALVRVGREGNGNRDTDRGGSLGICGCIGQRDGENKASGGGLLGVAVAKRSAGARDGLDLGLSLGTSRDSNTGTIDAEGNPGTRCRAWSRARNSLGLGLDLSLGGRSRGGSSAGGNDINSRGLLGAARLGLRLGLGGDNLRSASGVNRESDAGHLSWGCRDLGSPSGLTITNGERDLSDLGTITNGCIDIRMGT